MKNKKHFQLSICRTISKLNRIKQEIDSSLKHLKAIPLRIKRCSKCSRAHLRFREDGGYFYIGCGYNYKVKCKGGKNKNGKNKK